MKKIIVTAAVSAAFGAIVNCLLGHIFSCAFKAAGDKCPFE